MVSSKKLTLDLINEHLTCRLCSGYLIDAWTINECLHSFCRACIFSYFNENDENTTCPVCSTVPHPANPLLGITKDCWLQQIVYKLVPSLFKREMCRRRIYYDSHSDDKSKLIEQYSKTHSSQMGCREEELGELSERCLFQQKNKLNNKENLYLTLEYNEVNLKDLLTKPNLYFIECSSNMPVQILKQYLKKVLPLSKRTRYQIDILQEQKVLLDNLTLNHIYSWKPNKNKQLHLFYRVIIIEKDENETEKTENDPPISTEKESKPPAFVRSTSTYNNSSSFVHTTPFTPAEARTISLNNTITEQLHGNETVELIKPKECTLIDCKTIAMTTPINYSVNSIEEISKPKKRPKKSNSNDQSAPKKCKLKKVKEEKTIPNQLPQPTPSSLNPSPSENRNPNESIEPKALSYSEIIQEANKLLAAEEPLTPINNQSSSPPTTTATAAAAGSVANPTTTRLTKPIATVSPLHTSKNNPNRLMTTNDDNELIDLSKPTIVPNDVPLKIEQPKKRSRQTSSSTTRTKISRHSNKSNTDDVSSESTKSIKKTQSSQFLPPPPPAPVPHPPSSHPAQQQMFQNFFHTFQNQANYWPMNPWSMSPSLALMADPRNYYPQAWHAPPPPSTPTPPVHQQSVMHGPKDLSSVSLHDFIGDTNNPAFPMPPPSTLSSFSRTPSASSLHLTNRHRPTTLNGT